MASTGWVGKQATERSTDPLTRHRRTAPCPPLVLSFDESERTRRTLKLPPLLFIICLWIFGEGISQSRSHPQGPKSEFKEVTAAHVGCHCGGFPGSFLSGTLLSYGASTVARTSGREHVAKV